LNRDYPVIQGVILMLGMAVVLVNTLVDILLGVVDPRSIIRAT
jgi:peptide/nickel transport system permease protein